MTEPRDKTAKRKRIKELMRERTHDLRERVKELNCLYGISNLVQRPDISLEEMLQGTVDLIPPGWQYPEVTCARITLEGQEFRTEDFRETAWRQTADIIVNSQRTGAAEVCYLQEKPEADEGPFLKEERDLINAITETLGRMTERKRVEEALRESEERFRTLASSAPIGIMLVDSEKGVVYCNERFLSIFGLPWEKVMGSGWIQSLHPDEREAFLDERSKAMAEGREFIREFRLVTPQGETRWLTVHTTPLLSQEGASNTRVGTIEDISERKQAEDALRESGERYRSIFESIQDIFYRTDAEGIITEISPSVERFGFTREALIGTQVLGVYEDPEERSGLLKALLEQGGVADHEIRLKTGDGRLIDTSVSAHILRGPDGTLSGVEGTLRDISDRKAAEETLHESEEQLRNVLDVSRDLIYRLNLQTRTYEYVSPSSLRLVGFAPQEIVAMGLEGVIERFHPDDRERLGTHPSRLPEDTVEGRKAPIIEYRWQCNDGEYRWLSDNRAFVIDEDGRALALVGTVRDITEAMAAGEDKRKAYESIVTLLATGAEARDPYTEHHLPRIRGFAEAIAAEMGLPPDEIREIGLCSLLHDLGKMRVPDSILIKPGPLLLAEWKIMRQHPAWGEELLSTHPWLETARQIARWHHESWDGTGYPDGLRGEEIPLCAAIVAVADGFDAMTSDRPYKKAWPPRQAIEEVRAQKGRQYSPTVVEAFNRALRKGEIERIISADSARLPEMSEAA